MDIKNMITKKTQASRFIELDLFRGFAIMFMIFLHLIWDLDYFGLIPLNNSIYRLNIIVPTMFFILTGICLTVSTNKKPINADKTFHIITRGCWVLCLGFALTIATSIFLPDRPILFGVLHCIGLCIILSIPFLKYRLNPILTASSGIIIIAIGLLFRTISYQNPTIIHIIVGLRQANIWQSTIDYFPILPWFGVCLLGIAIGDVLYKDHKRQFHIPDISKYRPVSILSWMGQHSLLIYLVHQPVIAGVISAYLLF